MALQLCLVGSEPRGTDTKRVYWARALPGDLFGDVGWAAYFLGKDTCPLETVWGERVNWESAPRNTTPCLQMMNFRVGGSHLKMCLVNTETGRSEF